MTTKGAGRGVGAGVEADPREGLRAGIGARVRTGVRAGVRPSVRLAVGLALVVGLAGCLETTEPTALTEVRIAHLAPGAGSYRVDLDGRELLGSIAALQYTLLVVDSEPHGYTFAHLDSGVETAAEAPDSAITTVLLMNAAEPVARAYGMDRVEEGQRLMVVNADTAAADLTVMLEPADADTTRVTLAPGASETVALGTGTYGVRVHRGIVEEAVSLQSISLRQSDHGFLVIYPPDGETRYARFLF